MTNKEKLTERWENQRISEAMLRVYITKGIITEEDFEEITGNTSGLDPATQLEKAKQSKIAESKNALKEYLEAHPIKWIDGEYYSVTEEKQNLLTSNLASYQISVSLGSPIELTWNTTGERCKSWTYENLAALSLDIVKYVKPLVSKQQDIEIQIKNCSTKEEVNAVEIKY